MKTTTLLMALTAFGVLGLGLALADEPASQTSKPETKASGKTLERPTVLAHSTSTSGKTELKDAPHSRTITRSATPAPAIANPKPGNSLPQTASGKTAVASKNGLVADRAAIKPATPAKPFVAGTIPATGTSKNKIVTTAAVGGAASPAVKNSTATVSGANVKRKSPPF